MATTRYTGAEEDPGGNLSHRGDQPAGRFHAGRFQRPAQTHRADRRGLCRPGDCAQCGPHRAEGFRFQPRAAEEGRRAGIDKCRYSGGVRRRGDGQGVVVDHRRPHGQAGLVSPSPSAPMSALALCPSSGSAPTAQKKKYLPLLASGEWVGAYALSESSSGSDAMNARTKRRALRRRHALPAQRREDVDHQRLVCRCFRDLCQGGWRKVHGLHRRAHLSRLQLGPGGAQARHSRLLHLSADSQRLPGSGGERTRRGRQGSDNRLQHPERGTLQAGRGLRGRCAHLPRKFHQVGKGAQGLRQIHRRVRHGARDAGRHRHRHLCRRGAGLSHRRA